MAQTLFCRSDEVIHFIGNGLADLLATTFDSHKISVDTGVIKRKKSAASVTICSTSSSSAHASFLASFPFSLAFQEALGFYENEL